MGWKLVSHWGEAFIPNLLPWKTFGMDELHRASSPWWELLGAVLVSRLFVPTLLWCYRLLSVTFHQIFQLVLFQL